MTELKTLKDIQRARIKICNGCNKDCNGYKMKICKWNYNKLGVIFKQEAIKCVKKLREELGLMIKEAEKWNSTIDERPIGTNNPDWDKKYYANLGQQEWIARFFNITEEELK